MVEPQRDYMCKSYLQILPRNVHRVLLSLFFDEFKNNRDVTGNF